MISTISKHFLVITCFTFMLPLVVFAAVQEEQVENNIRQILATDQLLIHDMDILAESILLEIYQGHNFKRYWTNETNVQQLIGLISDSAEHGLMPQDYGQKLLQQLILQAPSASAQQLAELDILLTESLLRYGYHRRFGKVKGSTIDPDINFRREMFHQQAPSLTIRQAFDSGSLADFIDQTAPSGTFYKGIQGYLHEYRGIAAAGGWLVIPDGETMRLGDDNARVMALRERLAATGDLTAGAGTSQALFDQDLENAVIEFQSRHALDTDGLVGNNTLAEMNVDVEIRIDQLRLSLERVRWITQEAADRLVVVNIAGFRVFYMLNGKIEWVTPAMVGKHYRKTPVFRGDIAYLEFNPTWTIPPGILRNDTLPAIKRDPNYLASKNIRVIDRDGKIIDPHTVNWNQYSRGVPYTLRQDPGPWNALGTVKFIFPNEHFVFLHDTPHPELFSHKSRAFSSGCIRVKDPLKLAELLLDDPQKYNRAALESVVASKETRRIRPSVKIPVVITYLTASLELDGRARFLKDIYGRDQEVLAALNGPVILLPLDPEN